jgi:3-methyladenine DNA glycosylase AlkC
MTDERPLLKDLIDRRSVVALVDAVNRHHPHVVEETVVAEIFDEEWPGRELKQRIRHVAVVLSRYLPAEYADAIAVLKAAAGDVDDLGFTAMVFNDYVEEFGVSDPDVSLPALEVFTTLVSAEFAIRPFIDHYPGTVFPQLWTWAQSDDWRVRRLASEGSRPRLPWGKGVSALKEDPAPILPILATLRSDPSEVVRRSVANNLNDISKDHPDLVVEVLSSWQDGSPEIEALTKHALRTLLKRGHPGAMSVLGFPADPEIEVRIFDVQPATVPIGGSVQLNCVIESIGSDPQSLMIDYAVEFQNRSGRGTRKVFRGKVVELDTGESTDLRRKISLVPLSTREILSGTHAVEVQVNGRVCGRAEFQVTNQP